MNLRNSTDVGLLVRQRRRELGLDQATLAERVGVSRQWVVEIEAGKPRAEIGLVLRALRALGLTLRAKDPIDDGATDDLTVDRTSCAALPTSPIDQILRDARRRSSEEDA